MRGDKGRGGGGCRYGKVERDSSWGGAALHKLTSPRYNDRDDEDMTHVHCININWVSAALHSAALHALTSPLYDGRNEEEYTAHVRFTHRTNGRRSVDFLVVIHCSLIDDILQIGTNEYYLSLTFRRVSML